jgi:hypothetical protein
MLNHLVVIKTNSLYFVPIEHNKLVFQIRIGTEGYLIGCKDRKPIDLLLNAKKGINSLKFSQKFI